MESSYPYHFEIKNSRVGDKSLKRIETILSKEGIEFKETSSERRNAKYILKNPNLIIMLENNKEGIDCAFIFKPPLMQNYLQLAPELSERIRDFYSQKK